MRTIAYIQRTHKMIYCSPSKMPKSFPNLFVNCGWSSLWRTWVLCDILSGWRSQNNVLRENCFFSSQLHPTNSRALQHAIGLICFDPTSSQPLAITEGLPDIQSGGGSYEVGTINIGCWIIWNLNTARHNTFGWSFKHIHAQSWSMTLERSEAYRQISRWQTRLRHPFRTERTFGPSRLYQLDYVDCLDSRESTSRYFFSFERGAISWISKL